MLSQTQVHECIQTFKANEVRLAAETHPELIQEFAKDFESAIFSRTFKQELIQAEDKFQRSYECALCQMFPELPIDEARKMIKAVLGKVELFVSMVYQSNRTKGSLS